MNREKAILGLERVRDRTKIAEVADLCDILIGLLSVAVAKEQRAFDRLAYQREYMRRWREKRRREGR